MTFPKRCHFSDPRFGKVLTLSKAQKSRLAAKGVRKRAPKSSSKTTSGHFITLWKTKQNPNIDSQLMFGFRLIFPTAPAAKTKHKTGQPQQPKPHKTEQPQQPKPHKRNRCSSQKHSKCHSRSRQNHTQCLAAAAIAFFVVLAVLVCVVWAAAAVPPFWILVSDF